MAPGVDMKIFCPHPNFPERNIDVYSMGRRSNIVHKQLFELSKKGDIFYIYDTINDMRTSNHKEHRNLIANIAKRSKYFITYLPKQTFKNNVVQQMELGYRYFEGAGAGAVMIGETPECEVFKKYFDWSDAVINLPYDTQDVMEIILGLEKKTSHVNLIRKTSIIQSLLRNDWVYRWRDILKLVGMKETTSLSNRHNYMIKIANEVTKRM